MKKTSLLLIPFFFCLYLIFIPKISVNAQCVGSGCPGGTTGTTGPTGATGATGTVSSAFTRTGAVVAVSGDYTQSQITPTASQPAIYSCSTSSYSDPTYVCSTGASLSVVPVDGSLLIIKFAQACTDISLLALTVDSLTSKQIFSNDGTSGSTSGACAVINSYAILRFSNPLGVFSGFQLIGSGLYPICQVVGGMWYNAGPNSGCSNNFTITNGGADLKVVHIKGITGVTIAAGAAAGSSPTVTLSTNSNDHSGQINITTGTIPTTGVEATITFVIANTTAPFCTLRAANAATALVDNGTTMVFPSTTTTTLVINSGTAALTLSTAYSWVYNCLQ